MKQIKKIVKKILRPFRSKTITPDNSHQLEKYKHSIRLLYMLMQNTILKSLPSLTETRLKNLSNLSGLPISQGMYMMDLLEKTKHIEGDICEMGVAQGCTSRLIAEEISHSKQLWLFDSFQGLPEPTAEDKLIDDIFNLKDMKSYKGTMMSPRSLVEQKLAESTFPSKNVHIIEGFFPESIIGSKTLPQKCSFLFIDFDFYKPIKDALDFSKDKIQSGGYIMVHDYGFFSSGAKQAVDEFHMQNKDIFEISFPDKTAEGIAILKRL